MGIQGENFKITADIMKPIIKYYRQDKLKLVKFLVEEGYQKQKIAEVLGVTPPAISYLLKRNGGK